MWSRNLTMGVGLDTGANFVIDVAKTFEALYGYKPVSIPQMLAGPAPVQDNVGVTAAYWQRTPVQGLWPVKAQAVNLVDMLGRPVWLPISLIVSNKSTPKGTQYDFPYAMMSIKNKKIMKETPMVERGGSVIEEIGMGAWEIDVQGFLIDGYGQFPDDQLVLLQQLFSANQTGSGLTSLQTVTLRCAISDIFLGANQQVVITELEIPAKPKVIGVRDFSFKCVQDSILDLYKVSAPLQGTT